MGIFMFWHYSEHSAVLPPYMQQLPGWFTCTLNLTCTLVWEKGQEKPSRSASTVQQKTVLSIQPVYVIPFPLQSTTWFVCLASSLRSQAAGVFLVLGFFFLLGSIFSQALALFLKWHCHTKPLQQMLMFSSSNVCALFCSLLLKKIW